MFSSILGPDGLIVVAVLVVVLFFGGSKLPNLARGLGSASSEFRKGVAEGAIPDGETSSKESPKLSA